MDLVVIGGGQFGSALAQMYERQGRRVFKIQNAASHFDSSAAPIKRSVILLCVPTQALPALLEQRGGLLKEGAGIVSTAKGLIQKTGQTPTQFLAQHLGGAKTDRTSMKSSKIPPIFALSGPGFAAEIKASQPTALVLAGKASKTLDALTENLSTPQLRLYKSNDPLGVELSGAFKNVYAIAAGIAAGLGFGDSTRAALNTRALAEMARIGQVLGGKPLTFFGLAGVGDLFLTCSSPQSRNFQCGLGLARGETRETLLGKLGTIEGLWTAGEASRVCRKHKIRAPLLDTIVALLEKKLKPQEALLSLMTRKIRHEFE